VLFVFLFYLFAQVRISTDLPGNADDTDADNTDFNGLLWQISTLTPGYCIIYPRRDYAAI